MRNICYILVEERRLDHVTIIISRMITWYNSTVLLYLLLEYSNDDDCLNSIIPLCRQIPEANYDLLEQLMFHLAKYDLHHYNTHIAQHLIM